MKSALLFLITCSLYAQSSTPIDLPDALMHFTKVLEAQSMPTSPTVVDNHALIFGGGWVSCTSARAITITDGNGTAILPGVTPTADGNGRFSISLNLYAGAYFSGGFSWSASGSGCTAHAWWRR